MELSTGNQEKLKFEFNLEIHVTYSWIESWIWTRKGDGKKKRVRQRRKQSQDIYQSKIHQSNKIKPEYGASNLRVTRIEGTLDLLEPVVEGVGAAEDIGQEEIQEGPELVQVVLKKQKRKKNNKNMTQ